MTLKYKLPKMRVGWYLGWIFGLGFVILPALALIYALKEDVALWYWIATCLFLAILLPLGCLIIRFVIEEYKHSVDKEERC